MAAQDAPALAAVLAGGRGSRMGAPKATVPLGGRALIEHPLDALREAGLEAVVVAKPGSRLPALDVAVWEEPAEPVHPLCGVLRALEGASGRPVLAVACDMPFLAPGLLARLAAADGPLVVPEVAGRLQPLLARYSPALAVALADALRRRAALTDVVRELAPSVLGEATLRRFGDPERLLFNVNDRDDLARAQRLLAA
ncbi:MAG: molybdenum cofactor guanylyltransferase [Solirubrobacteraceae bacterium]|jgi:molybdenum cofactor guanylyltransferase